MDTLKTYVSQASAWVAANPTDTVYAALIIAGLALMSAAGGKR